MSHETSVSHDDVRDTCYAPSPCVHAETMIYCMVKREARDLGGAVSQECLTRRPRGKGEAGFLYMVNSLRLHYVIK